MKCCRIIGLRLREKRRPALHELPWRLVSEGAWVVPNGFAAPRPDHRPQQDAASVGMVFGALYPDSRTWRCRKALDHSADESGAPCLPRQRGGRPGGALLAKVGSAIARRLALEACPRQPAAAGSHRRARWRWRRRLCCSM
ncbi:hypothetical protein LNQ03_28225 [Klebsiella pneumoniae subsp. pneumoniae]|nr:hypothetical protein [Klebsiella pneumoniae subsp. pneumoniae]